MAKRYAIKDLAHPVLGKRLKEITGALLNLDSGNATEVMGSPDDLKLRSSMTLFALVAGNDSVFDKVLEKFFDGQKDAATLQLVR